MFFLWACSAVRPGRNILCCLLWNFVISFGPPVSVVVVSWLDSIYKAGQEAFFHRTTPGKGYKAFGERLGATVRSKSTTS